MKTLNNKIGLQLSSVLLIRHSTTCSFNDQLPAGGSKKSLFSANVQTMLYRLLFAFVFAAISFTEAYGAAKTFTGPGNFSDPTKWNSGTLPPVGDDLRINGVCIIDNSVLTDNVAYGTINVGRSSAATIVWPVGGTNRLNVTGFSTSTTGIVDMTNGGTIILNGTWSSGADIDFIPGVGTIIVNTASTLPSEYSAYNNLIIDAAGTTTTNATTITVNFLTLTSGNFTAPSASLNISGDLAITAGTFTAGTNLNIAGNWTRATGSTFTHSSGTVTFNGAGAQTINGTITSQTFNKLVVDKSAGTLSTGGSTTAMVFAGDFTQTSGNFTAPGTLSISGNMVLTAGTFTAGASISLAGNLTKSSASTFTHSSGTVTFNGTAAQSINGTATSQTFSKIVVAKTAGTLLNVSGSTATLTVASDFTQTTGNFTAPATMNIAGNTVLTAGTFTAGNNINVSGNWTKASAAVFTPGTGTVTFDGSVAQTINGTSVSQTFNNIAVAKTAGTLLNTGGSTVTLIANDFTQSTGNFTSPATMNINGDLVISAGTYTTGANTNIMGDLLNSPGATFDTGTGTVTKNGSSPAIIGGTGASTFYNLVISNTGGNSLGANITVNNNINLSGGSLSLSTNNLTLGTTASLSNFNASRYIMTNNNPLSGGFLIQYVSGTKIFPVGTSTYTPVTVANSGTADNYRVRVFDGVYTDGTSGGLHSNISHSVNRTWLVEEATAGGSNVTLTLQWNTADENASFVQSFCGVFHYTGGAWDSPASFDPANNISADVFSISRSGISSFSPFSVGDGMSPLPVELLSFTAKLSDKQVELKWITATELNNSYFAIERSADGKDFETIDKVDGAGNSNSLISYTYSDLSPLMQNVSYYRLRQVDFDGTTAYSSIVAVKSAASLTIGDLYPMPVQENVNIPVESLKAGICTVGIYDISGRLVYSEEFTLVSASQTLSISTAGLPQGAYVLNIQNNGDAHSMKLLK